jgi:hypothetical protein
MVEPVVGPLPIAQLRLELQAAHDYLAKAGQAAVRHLGTATLESWGADVKRVTVALDDAPPARVSRRGHHNFVEVVNQCATLERLIDALAWAEVGLPGYVARSCHPTTSSTTAAHDHDLVLDAEDGRLPAWFEVSDILSGPHKEKKDLQALGVPATSAHGDWPAGRLFLVASAGMATRVNKPTRRLLRCGGFRYEAREHANEARTGILEVVRVLAPRAAELFAAGAWHLRARGRGGGALLGENRGLRSARRSSDGR